MKKEIWLLGALGLIMVILLGILFLVPAKPKQNTQPQNVEGLQILSPKANEEITSPVKISGTISGNGWTAFEGETGVVKLLDQTGKQLAMEVLTATTDWMQSSVDFQAYLQFSSDKDQNGTLVFTNENPSGMTEKNRQFILPVKIKKSSGELMKVKAFFNNNVSDPQISCNKVFPIVRDVPKTTAVARAALTELLNGLTPAEKNAGFSTSINPGVKIQSLTIENGVAKVDFDEKLEFQVGGSCKVSAIRAQITETLKQFSTISSVVISINGRTEDILQP